MAYTYKPRTVGDLRKQFPGYFQQHRITLPDETVAYFGLPNNGLLDMTVVPNLSAEGHTMVLGQTFGHYQPRVQGAPDIIEVYEFHTPGALLIDKPEEPTVDFICADHGQKIAVPGNCHMTLYNLSSSPLITVDVCNPAFHKPEKKLQEELGPMLTILASTSYEITVVLNPRYINRPQHDAGVHLPSFPTDDQVQIRIPLHHNLDSNGFLWDFFEDDKAEHRRDALEHYGIRVLEARQDPVVGSALTRPLYEYLPSVSPLRQYLRLDTG